MWAAAVPTPVSAPRGRGGPCTVGARACLTRAVNPEGVRGAWSPAAAVRQARRCATLTGSGPTARGRLVWPFSRVLSARPTRPLLRSGQGRFRFLGFELERDRDRDGGRDRGRGSRALSPRPGTARAPFWVVFAARPVAVTSQWNVVRLAVSCRSGTLAEVSRGRGVRNSPCAETGRPWPTESHSLAKPLAPPGCVGSPRAAAVGTWALVAAAGSGRPVGAEGAAPGSGAHRGGREEGL